MKISVVICTKDRPEELHKALATISAQTRKPDGILIVDASARKNEVVDSLRTREELDGIATKVFHVPPGLVKQRNFGVTQVADDIDIVLFIDDDVELDKEYMVHIAGIFQRRPEILGATGFIANLPAAGLLGRFNKNGSVDRAARNFFARDVEGCLDLMWLSGCNMAYRREVFEHELFDEFFETYGLGEDLEFSYRVAKRGKLAFVPQARLVHHESPTARIGLRRLGRMYVINKSYIVKKHPEYFSGTHLYLLFLAKWLAFFVAGYVLGDSRKREWFLGFTDGFRELLHRQGNARG